MFANKALNKRAMDGVWKDYLVPKAQQVLRLIVSRDPVGCRNLCQCTQHLHYIFLQNDMIGPDGYGDSHFISPSQVLEYTIRFENDPNATAPAQTVIVTHVLDKDLDVRTFRLGPFGFGSYSRDVMFNTGILQVSCYKY